MKNNQIAFITGASRGIGFAIAKAFVLNGTNVVCASRNSKDLEKAVDTIKPPIFWKDKPIFNKQMKKWNINKLKEAKRILFKTELQIKKNANLNNNVLLKNLIINLYEKAEATF